MKPVIDALDIIHREFSPDEYKVWEQKWVDGWNDYENSLIIRDIIAICGVGNEINKKSI